MAVLLFEGISTPLFRYGSLVYLLAPFFVPQRSYPSLSQHFPSPENHWLPSDLFAASQEGKVIPPSSWHEDVQSLEGVVIGLEDDQKLRWAIAAVPSIRFYRYQISFKLIDG